MSKDNRFRRTTSYVIGEDFSKEEYDKWLAQITLWISETQNVDNPREKAKNILTAAIKGTKLNGEAWVGVESYDLQKRIMQFCGWDIIKEKGKVNTGRGRPRKNQRKTNKEREKHKENIDEFELYGLEEEREAYKQILYTEFPFLDNPVYEANVNALADSTVKLQKTSEEFLGAEKSELSKLLKIRDSLKKDIDDFMKLLRIHPSQLKDRVDDSDRGDVGTLINKFEEYGDVANVYEQVDAIQEAIQIINQLENDRMDGSPQLTSWMLWHKTGCRGHEFVCECGKKYDIHGGFTKEEMYAIAEQAKKVFGFGIEPRKVDAEESKEPAEQT